MNAEDRWVALIDESADGDIYRIGALVMPAGQRRLLAADLDAVMDRAEVKYGIPASTELHGFEMFQGHGVWRDLKPWERIDVYGQALDAIAFRADALIFEAIYRPEFQRIYAGRGYNEHEAALMYTLERIHERAVSKQQACYVFADECRFAASVVRSLLHFQQFGTWGYRKKNLDRILKIEFVDSSKYRQIQAVDLVTYLKTRIDSDRDAQRPRVARANERLWKKVDGIVTRDRVWLDDRTGKTYRFEMHDGPRRGTRAEGWTLGLKPYRVA
ncbi:DUF3800 domain-containing protein [Cellulomonas fimi]|uniref:DUF3800 domain-containing protein n=1 Tax=Cellulomonas fimi TaxID=1708 RepID=UPI0023599ADB|nr:DUF3800 domain-containing protein [Cellulomonas fimi]